MFFICFGNYLNVYVWTAIHYHDKLVFINIIYFINNSRTNNDVPAMCFKTEF